VEERRRHRRREVSARVEMTDETGRRYSGRSRNISDGGFYIVLDRPVVLAPHTRVKLTLPDSEDPTLVFNAEVMRCEEGGMALRVLSFEAGGEEHDLDVLRQAWFESRGGT